MATLVLNGIAIPEGFEEVGVLDGVHHFARGLQCTRCKTQLEGEGSSPDTAMEAVVKLAHNHVCPDSGKQRLATLTVKANKHKTQDLQGFRGFLKALGDRITFEEKPDHIEVKCDEDFASGVVSVVARFGYWVSDIQ